MPEIKERPILFSGPMVRAILEGRKTVTRRAIKKPPADGWAFDGEYGRITSPHPRRGRFGAFIRRGVGTDFPELDIVPCPYGMPGDRLWVRETYVGFQGGAVHYRATEPEWPAGKGLYHPWRPSIHMPRWASRILLEVTDVRVERLQDITYEQAAAEGIHRDHRMWFATDEGGYAHRYPREAFRDLWISTGGDWDTNPLVWAIEFKRIQP